MNRLYCLSDNEFGLIEPLIQQEKKKQGRPNKISDRDALEAALYVMRQGCTWRALPQEFGHWLAVYMRYKRWTERGLWWKILRKLQDLNRIKIEVVMIDSSCIRAHRHAAGARKKEDRKH